MSAPPSTARARRRLVSLRAGRAGRQWQHSGRTVITATGRLVRLLLRVRCALHRPRADFARQLVSSAVEIATHARHRPRTPETGRGRRWFMDKALRRWWCRHDDHERRRRYVGCPDEGHAAVRLKEVNDHLSDSYFFRIGETEDSSAFSRRGHRPVVLIEYDAQSPPAYGTRNSGGTGGPNATPTQQHIHTVVRTPIGDDHGVDLLELRLTKYH
ncbi:DUF3500 domain-containing protein [Streptomyces sp. NPDC059582]|uniref:DUF3500 domain-containing protein n=1 Tax=Streptomyces sp. NPDC059582 TaxID=3346875 RepID=UPI0036D17D7E